VFERITSFVDYLYRSFRRSRWPTMGTDHVDFCRTLGYHVFPRNVVIVSHVRKRSFFTFVLKVFHSMAQGFHQGLTMRLFLMRYFHMSVDEFHSIYNPKYRK
jgi:hypothetical protein